jgi:Ca2+-binding EF-hand superfamily protein
MARCIWTLVLSLLTTAAAVAQSPGDEGPGNNAGRAARRATQPATEPAAAEEEEMEDAPAEGQRRRGRGEESEGRRGRGEAGEDRGRFGGGFRRSNPIFEALDADSDGSISTAELRKAAVALKKLDADSDGKITLAEASPQGGPGGPGGPFGGGDPTQMVDGMIRQMDRNRDGRIGLDEVDERSLRMLSNIRDVNGDGALDRAELLAGMEQMQQRFGGGGGPFGGGPGGGGGFDGARMTERMMANDANGDGKLSPDEVPEQFRGMLQGGDENNDGTIDARELEMATRRMGDRFRGGFGGDRGGRSERGAGRGGEEGEGDEAGERRSRRQRPEAEE